MPSFARASTGLHGLDAVIDSLRTGDNVVWQVDDVAEYRQFVTPYVTSALTAGNRVVYMRFARHEPLVDDERVAVHTLDANAGFESFATDVHGIITREGERACYVFDCLSDLVEAWASDLMIGNFFAVTCPRLFELDTLAYFALLRNSHSFKTIARIRETTQLLLDVHTDGNELYVHPLKVWNRYSPTMFLPHHRRGDAYAPIITSVDATALFSRIAARDVERARRYLDYWDRLFLDAADLLGASGREDETRRMVERLVRVMIAREPRMASLAAEYFSLEDLLEIKERVIGTGFVGGKTVGMLLARGILLRDEGHDWRGVLEPHDSHYIGSDVFCTYVVENGWWRMRMEQRTKEGYFAVAGALRERMLGGAFPAEIREQFQQMIEYYGQSPIIVRSSSLLEDSFGNAFAGKYESKFCVNQGTPGQRYAQFEEAVRHIYASTMSEDALTYRLHRGLADMDEQMALLVQRVSGAQHRQYFFPALAGVGVSYNTFVWKKDMDPRAGMLRLVLGLGTRAVNRVDGDYPRIIALDDPLRRPLAGMENVRKYSQHDVDVLDTAGNEVKTVPFSAIPAEDYGVDPALVAVRDDESSRSFEERGIQRDVWILTFDPLLSETAFAPLMQRLMKRLEAVYNYPVDIEFTANYAQDGTVRVNVLQCRPLQARGLGTTVDLPSDVDPGAVLFSSTGNFMGGNISHPVGRIVYVDPAEYLALPTSGKHDIARLVGKINRLVTDREDSRLVLLGPGRWGTTTPSLGVPVSFAEINNTSVMVEIAHATDGLMPELSFGTHFFQDLVECEIAYVALFPGREGVVFNRGMLDALPNRLAALFPAGQRYEHVVKVVDLPGASAHFYADVVSQRVLLLLGRQ